MTQSDILLVTLTAAFALMLGMLVGGYLEPRKTRSLERKLRVSQAETQGLREYIWLVTAGDPTTQSLTKGEALPESSVQVERFPHQNSGRASE